MLLKICKNLINNPNQTQKYGKLNLQKIGQKLSNCEPALKLLLYVGFEMSQDKKRLIWSHTQNNMMLLQHVQTILSTMIDVGPKILSNATQYNANTINNSITSNFETQQSTVCLS